MLAVITFYKQYAQYIWIAVAVIAIGGYWYSLTNTITELNEKNDLLNQQIGSLESALQMEQQNVIALKTAIARQNEKIADWNLKYNQISTELNAALAEQQVIRDEATKKNTILITQIEHAPPSANCEQAVGNIVNTILSNSWKK